MFSAEAWGERSLLERIHDSIWGSEELFEDDPHSCSRGKGSNFLDADAGGVERTSDDFSEEEKVNRLVDGTLATLVRVF